MSTTPIIQFLERFLNVTSSRQSLIVNNMANIDTPGFHTQDVDFHSELQRLASSDDDATMTTVAHHVPGLLQRPDGNDVSLDRESLALSETQLQYRLGIQFIKGEFHRLMSAINGGSNS